MTQIELLQEQSVILGRLEERVVSLKESSQEVNFKLTKLLEQNHNHNMRLTMIEQKEKGWRKIVDIGYKVLSSCVIAFLVWKMKDWGLK